LTGSLSGLTVFIGVFDNPAKGTVLYLFRINIFRANNKQKGASRLGQGPAEILPDGRFRNSISKLLVNLEGL